MLQLLPDTESHPDHEEKKLLPLEEGARSATFTLFAVTLVYEASPGPDAYVVPAAHEGAGVPLVCSTVTFEY